MSITEKLAEHGYRLYDREDWGSVGGQTMKFQKRVDDIYKDAPLCSMNEKLFIGVTMTMFRLNTTFEIQICQESKQGDWCDLKIYAIPEAKFFREVVEYEKKLIELWKLFNIL